MREFPLPVLGLENSPTSFAVIWKDGTPCGVLSAVSDPEIKARVDAEQARNEALRKQPNVVLLEDWRQSD
jgi:hypothetical protein